MRATVDEMICQGHTLCNMTAPELFKLRDDDGHAYVENEAVPPGQEETARSAAATCPEKAITIAE
jgi:ferredoxin